MDFCKNTDVYAVFADGLKTIMAKEIHEFIAPIGIVGCRGTTNEGFLIGNLIDQVPLGGTEYASLKPDGYILLDYGKEISGGLRLLTQCVKSPNPSARIRVRFGESATEASSELGEKNSGNHHSTRDFICNAQNLSEIRLGSTGFRFIRIDNLDESEIGLLSVQADFTHSDAVAVGDFSCDDRLINDIFAAAERTVFLNMQNGVLWDGVKRDRLVWSGDLYVELLSCFYIYGNVENIVNSLDACLVNARCEGWVNRIPAYSLWLILNVAEYCKFSGDYDYAEKLRAYVDVLIEKLKICVTDDGFFEPTRIGVEKSRFPFFVDWPTNGNEDARYAVQAILKRALERAIEVYDAVGYDAGELRALYDKVKKTQPKLTDSKALNAIQMLYGGAKGADFTKSLLDGNAKGVSSFMSYFILTALFNAGKKKEAVAMMKEYFGAMLEMGATTFFEDFDIEWKDECFPIYSTGQDGKADMHGDRGKYCYKGFRHSLCHGWASGAAAFLIESVAGLKVLESGFAKIAVKPETCGLKKIDCTVATPRGAIKIKIRDIDGRVEKEITVPDGITVIE